MNIQNNVDMSDTSSVTQVCDNIKLFKLTIANRNQSNQANQITYDQLLEKKETKKKKIIREESKEMEEISKQYNLKKLAKTIVIPTSDKEIKKRLREIGKPIILFGEKVHERSERLRREYEQLVIDYGRIPDFLLKGSGNIFKSEERIAEDEEFYTEGPNELCNLRKECALFSIPRSTYRIEVTKKRFMELDRIQEGIDYDQYLEKFKNYEFISSQMADERGCSRGSLTPDGSLYGVAGWSGLCTIFDVENLNKVTFLRGHTEKVNSLAFNPGYKTQIDPRGPNVLTGSSDNTIRLWSLGEGEFQKSIVFKGHEDRVNMVDFHPIGTFFASTSHDKTWRFWDVNTKKEILLQEGHNAPVYAISFQNDGALVATGDLSGIGLIWDIRSGRCVMPLVGHVKQIVSIKFSGNCYQVASGGDDNTMKIWDLRRHSCLYTVPAHNSTVSDITFENSDSKFIVTCSFDSSFKIWNNRDWSLIKAYLGPTEERFTSVSLSKDNNAIITASLERTIKLWKIKESKNEMID